MLNEIVPVDHELWMRDSNTKTCLNCEAQFTTFRRRHHCRYCGLIFCSKCTFKKKVVISGQNLRRICTKCYNSLVSKRMNSTTSFQNTPEALSAGVNSFHKDQKPDSASSTDEDLSMNKVFTVSNDIPHEVEMILGELNFNSKWDEMCDGYLKTRTQELLNENKISLEWEDIILNVVKNSVKVICPSVQFRGDFMDIGRYIKFQKVTWTHSQISAFFHGVAFIKNLAHKKMLKSIQNPKILLIKEISEGSHTDKALISMDKLIDQEMSLTNITLKKILSIGPKVIMCNKGLPQQFLNELAKSNISALINVKKSLMNVVARATQGKVLNNTDEIHHERNFLGQCNSFFQENRGETVLIHFSGLNDPSLIGSILLSAPDPDQIKPLKAIIRQLLLEYRNTRIEKSLFENFPVKSEANAFYELKNESFTFKHIVIAENKMCIKPDCVCVEFYKQKDMALGEFIILAAEKADQRCNDCGCSWGAHSLYYINNDTRIKITFSKWSIENKSTDIYITKECKDCGKGDAPAILLPKSIWEYSFFKFLSNFTRKTSINFSGVKCKHPFFPTTRFIFHVKTLKILISSEENFLYNITSTPVPDQSHFFEEILKFNLEELKIYTSSLIEKILLKYRDSCNQIIKDLAEEKLKNQDLIIDFTSSLDKVNSRSIALNKEINELQIVQFENYLQVESMRKKVFFQILEIRRAMLESLPILQRNRRRDRVVLDTVSSSGESSGDRKLSPSPNPSFVDDETGLRVRKESVSTRHAYSKGYEEILQQPEFTYLQKGNLTLGTGMNDQVIPVIEADLMSIIAYALNSVEYYEQVLYSMPSIKDTDKIESILLTPNENHFQTQFTTCDDDYFKDLAGKENMNAVYGNYVTFNVHTFFPKQFQVIRDKVIGPHLQFILGMFSSQSKKEQLGKSKASFFKSNNNVYILKVVDEKEFQMFKELAPNYFKHFCNSEFHSMPGLMVRTLGCFRVYIKNHTKGKSKCKWVLLSENLGHSMPKEVEIYDLKGSFNHRRFANIKEKQTKMDRNFLEDFNGLPLMIPKEAKKLIEIGVWNDSLFLSKNNVVDYSLLLIICKQSKTVTMGIIDYIAKYTLEKAIEHKYKKVVGTDNPTITKPAMYKSRFRDSISNFFFLAWEDK